MRALLYVCGACVERHLCSKAVGSIHSAWNCLLMHATGFTVRNEGEE